MDADVPARRLFFFFSGPFFCPTLNWRRERGWDGEAKVPLIASLTLSPSRPLLPFLSKVDSWSCRDP